MIDPTHQCPHHALHFQFKKQSCHTIHRNIGFHYQYVDMQVAQTCKDADHKFFYLKVADSGIGIPAEFKERVFERFYRVDKARSRETGGTGLGLAITKSVVLMHHGAIRVDSVEGEGSTFMVRIPLIYIP